MKKTLLFVFCASILLCATSAHAQTAQASQTTTLDASGMIVRPMAGTEYGVSIVVTDLKGNPKQGVYVTAPCAGSAKYTDAHGVAAWYGSGVCPCNSSPATVTTSGCELYPKVSCGTNNVVCP
ncbi:MAG: hypothetical protein JSS76_09515 [Bacteroidetes bacterium]|nr:hypothetical protein [Bacteroidota bacterium]